MRSTTEYARFFRADDLGPLDCLDARYRRQVFAPHFHEAFVVNTLLAGAQRYRYRGSGPGGPFARYRRAPRIGAGIEPVGVTADHAGDGRG